MHTVICIIGATHWLCTSSGCQHCKIRRCDHLNILLRLDYIPYITLFTISPHVGVLTWFRPFLWQISRTPLWWKRNIIDHWNCAYSRWPEEKGTRRLWPGARATWGGRYPFQTDRRASCAAVRRPAAAAEGATTRAFSTVPSAAGR